MGDEAAAGRGTLFLVVGPSGVGKDSLIAYCRDRLAPDSAIRFPRRVVTRDEATPFEDHDVLPEAAFAAEAGAGAFALHWRAHGLAYGIPAGIDLHLAAGRSVVVNVSRAILDRARRRFRPLVIVSIVAPAAVLAERLQGRGRESADEIRRRLDRADPCAVSGPEVVEIDNSGRLDEAGEAMLALLKDATARTG